MQPAGFETRKPSKRTAAEPHIKPSGHWNRQMEGEGPAEC
jgi:hypothetical protein